MVSLVTRRSAVSISHDQFSSSCWRHAFDAFLVRGVCGVSVCCRDCIVGALGLATVVCVCLLSDTWFSMLDVITLALMPRHPCRHVNRHTAARRRGTTPGMGECLDYISWETTGKGRASHHREAKEGKEERPTTSSVESLLSLQTEQAKVTYETSGVHRL